MLEIGIVTAEIGGHAILLEERTPRGNQLVRIAMGSIAVKWVMAKGERPRRARFLKFTFHPSLLLLLFLLGEIGKVIVVVAVEDEAGDEWIVRGVVHAVPFGRHFPPRLRVCVRVGE